MRPVNKPIPLNSSNLKSSNRQSPYDSIQTALMDTIGNYCSFCEVPIHVGKFIEHKSSRQLEVVPSFTEWPNLLLSCKFCRESKMNHFISDGSYLWPDSDSTFTLDDSSPLIYRMKNVDVITAIEGAQGRSNQEMVIVEANPLVSHSEREKAQRTIDLFQLNTPFYNNDDNTLIFSGDNVSSQLDSRLVQRTLAWSRAQESVEILQQASAQSELPLVYDMALKNLASLAQVSGFWSIWMTVFWEAFKDPNLIKKLFVEVDTADGYLLTGYQPKVEEYEYEDSQKRQHLSRQPPSASLYKIFTGTASKRITYSKTVSSAP